VDELLRDQLAYYRARAGEYDEWFLRRGRYDQGPEENRRWFEEAELVRRRLADFLGERARTVGQPLRVLELACGTGIWTAVLAGAGGAPDEPSTGTRAPVADVTAVDAAPEMLARAAERLESVRAAAWGGPRVVAPVRFARADLFAAEPAIPDLGSYDVAFLGFWLSHVPAARFDGFWALVRRALRSGGAAFFVDSRYTALSTAHDHVLPPPDAGTHTRRLNDGREFRVVKVFYDAADLAARLAALGWHARVDVTPTYFLYGSATA
jgi:demethylmenaquinone methyltransferase/2-methoxy-6-polyprenyl-1,4-benzoquinol methylase